MGPLWVDHRLAVRGQDTVPGDEAGPVSGTAGRDERHQGSLRGTEPTDGDPDAYEVRAASSRGPVHLFDRGGREIDGTGFGMRAMVSVNSSSKATSSRPAPMPGVTIDRRLSGPAKPTFLYASGPLGYQFVAPPCAVRGRGRRREGPAHDRRETGGPFCPTETHRAAEHGVAR